VQQLGVREDDSELVVQAVEEETQFGRVVHRSPRRERFGTHVPHQAWFRPSVCHSAGAAVRDVPFGSLHRVSTKIRTEPPAVRTYSIFPLDSQL
jgi:hypothetical protein